MAYAERTSVSTEKTRSEIDALVHKYGATSFQYSTMQRDGLAAAQILFGMADRYVRFYLPLPDMNERRFTHSSRGLRSKDAHKKAWEQACRSSWRALLLAIKAKLEAVEIGITTFEEEFLAHIVMPDNRTIAEHTLPVIEQAYETGKMGSGPILMLAPGGNE